MMSLRRKQQYLSLWWTLSVVCLLLAANSQGFSPSLPALTTSSHRTGSALLAKKKKKTPKALSSPGGGFGSATSASTGPQVRAVTGHTGSGTKPLRQAANTFDALRKEFGTEVCRDVYVRAPLNDEQTFWFVGKIAINPNKESVTPDMAVLSQKRLILEYAKHQLRPQNLGGKFETGQEIWLAPGDSEMEVVQNKIGLDKVSGSAADLPHDFVVKETVGFNPEIYVGDEVQKGGLRVQRDPITGAPLKPVFEVNESV
ncbi:expressed unknown protein [Seminavis robusta]|uniref:Uncharacterized protein n=1 Tax=Seminavis robusta TaxID=568900 RepID=A0A9N8HBK9_9STRA|nr:expressed unknown protein [Seminavis robusta]|eukprot:Sro265_g102750.1 n/a (257) ;mRNA; f:21760-22530